MATPRTMNKRSRDIVQSDLSKRESAVGRPRKRAVKCDETPDVGVAKDLCAAMSVASLASNRSAHTVVVKRLALTKGSVAKDTPDFHNTTSPRLESRLARRPQPQFPYSLQPFQLLPASPEDRVQLSVEEANRRIRQAQALSERQQEFGQLLDLASSGYIPNHQCGPANDPVAAQPAEENAQELENGIEQAARSPTPEVVDPTVAAAAASRPRSVSPGATVISAIPRRLTQAPAGCVLTSREGRGSIRILRMA